MTKKDYIKLAAALASVRPNTSDPERELWHDTRAAIARVLAGDNGRFDRDRFDRATEA